MSGWRENVEGERLALTITPLGLAAIGVEAEIGAVAVVGPACTEHSDVPQGALIPAEKPSHSPVCDGRWIPSPRQDTKKAMVIALLRQAGGASIDDIVTLTGWLPHTARAALTGFAQGWMDDRVGSTARSATTYRIADKIDAGAALSRPVPKVANTAATDHPALAREIAALANLDLYGLRVKWRKLMRKPAPEHLNRSILMRVIAYRMQARVFGDLDAESVKALDRIARDHDRRRRAGVLRPKAVPQVPPVPPDRGHKPEPCSSANMRARCIASRLPAMASNGGANSIGPLSDIARRITGTSWSGPRFFGLRERSRKDTPS